MTPEEQVKLYEQDTNAEQKIRDAITGAYKDLQPESELVRTYENEQFPSFYSALSGYGADTGLTDLSPLTLLQNAWNNQARMATVAQVARDAFDVRRAGMEDLIKTGVSQWATGYQGAQNAYDRWWAQKQHEDQMALAREQMAAAKRASRAARTTTSFNAPQPNNNNNKTLTMDDVITLAYQIANKTAQANKSTQLPTGLDRFRLISRRSSSGTGRGGGGSVGGAW